MIQRVNCVQHEQNYAKFYKYFPALDNQIEYQRSYQLQKITSKTKNQKNKYYSNIQKNKQMVLNSNVDSLYGEIGRHARLKTSSV